MINGLAEKAPWSDLGYAHAFEIHFPLEGAVEKPRMRPPQTVNASSLTLSSRRRSNATEKGLLKKSSSFGRFLPHRSK
ncbi:MAG: hypothetical protein OXL41_04590, partial [Nitrospinae bacterium]|nr:hypothetical protein [Nitrospinota bacterium]